MEAASFGPSAFFGGRQKPSWQVGRKPLCQASFDALRNELQH